MACKDMTKVRGLGESIENITGKIPLKREKQIEPKASQKPRGNAIMGQTYKFQKGLNITKLNTGR